MLFVLCYNAFSQIPNTTTDMEAVRFMLKFFTRIRILLWVLLLVGVGFMVSTQVRAKLAQAAANLRSLETETVTVYPVETETVKADNWETWRSY